MGPYFYTLIGVITLLSAITSRQNALAVSSQKQRGETVKVSEQYNLLSVINHKLRQTMSEITPGHEETAAMLLLHYKILQKASDSVAHAARSSAFGLRQGDQNIQNLILHSDLSLTEKGLFSALNTSELGFLLEQVHLSDVTISDLDQRVLKAREQSRLAVFQLQKEGESDQNTLSAARFKAVSQVFETFFKEQFPDIWWRDFSLTLDLVKKAGLDAGGMEENLRKAKVYLDDKVSSEGITQ